MRREVAPNYPPGGSQRLKEKQPRGLRPDFAMIEHLDRHGKVTAETEAYMNNDMKKALGLKTPEKPRMKPRIVKYFVPEEIK